MTIDLSVGGFGALLAKAPPVCFAFKDISEADRERLELLIFDTVLAQMARE